MLWCILLFQRLFTRYLLECKSWDFWPTLIQHRRTELLASPLALPFFSVRFPSDTASCHCTWHCIMLEDEGARSVSSIMWKTRRLQGYGAPLQGENIEHIQYRGDEHAGTLRQLVMNAKQIQMRNKQKFINVWVWWIFETSYRRKEGIFCLLMFSGQNQVSLWKRGLRQKRFLAKSTWTS